MTITVAPEYHVLVATGYSASDIHHTKTSSTWATSIVVSRGSTASA